MARPPYEYDPYYLQPDQDRNLINTLFVSGLPDDVKAREIHNLFRRRAGFDYCQLKYTGRGNQVIKHLSFFRESFYFLFVFREIYSFVTTHCNEGPEHIVLFLFIISSNYEDGLNFETVEILELFL